MRCVAFVLLLGLGFGCSWPCFGAAVFWVLLGASAGLGLAGWLWFFGFGVVCLGWLWLAGWVWFVSACLVWPCSALPVPLPGPGFRRVLGWFDSRLGDSEKIFL